MLDMSSEKNAVIFMVDAVDSALFREIMETEDPENQEWFKDFTYYPNTVGSYTYTSHAVPFVLSGKWMENQEAFESFETKAMDESPLFNTLEEQGYRLGLYEDQLTYESDGIYRFENVSDDHYRLNSVGEYIRQSFYVTWFQYMPYPLKPLFSREDAFENIQNRAVGQEEPYVGSNTTVYERIRNEDFTIGEEPCFRFIHIEGAHVPFEHDRNANEIPREEGSYPQSIQASATIVHAYIEKMKKAGIYDNSVIIVLADHGFVYSDNVDGIKGRSNPLLLVKGRDETHDMKISEQPVSHADLQTMYQKLLAGEKTETLFDFNEGEQRNRRFLGFNYNDPDLIIEYVQTGYASDYDAMTETGRVYQFQK
jgi:arylsulfatase A-like enzyme